jgi:hypothetical protein
MPALYRPTTDATFVLRRRGGIFGAAQMLLLWRRAMSLLLQRQAGLARRTMPVRSQQVGSRARSDADQFAD